MSSLNCINEPLGPFSIWLSKLIQYFASQNYKPSLLAYFIPQIQRNLNSIFLHVIDNSYETEKQESIIKNHANLVKAVAGKLDTDIEHFIDRLENQIHNDGK
jgi:hypothetical protein